MRAAGHEAGGVDAGLLSRDRHWGELLSTGALAGAALLLVGIVVWMAADIVRQGPRGLDPGFVFGGISQGMFDARRSGVFPMVFGTVALVMVMTVLVVPVGVMTALYLHEYADRSAWWTRAIRMAVNNLAGVPSIVFGLFGLGFFVYFIGSGMDRVLGHSDPVWGKPALIWASLTMAALTIPVVVVSTEEALNMVPASWREASYGLGGSRWDTLFGVILPQALPGILTGGILAISRGAGEVAPIMFTGAAYMAAMPNSLDDQFMELGYHIYVLATQSPDVEATKPMLFATTVVLLLLTLMLNALAIVARSRVRSRNRRLNPA